MNSIKLPMNKNPYIHSNVSRASLFSVLTSEAYAGKQNAVISDFCLEIDGKSFQGCCSNDFDVMLDKITYERENKKWIFYSHPYEENKFAYLFRKISFRDEFCMEVKVDYLQDANALSCIKLVLSNGVGNYIKAKKEHEFENACSFSITSNGRLTFHTNLIEKAIEIKNLSMDTPIYLRMSKKDYFLVEYSYNHEQWFEVFKSAAILIKFEEAGLYVSPKISPFFYDFFISHIPLCYTSDTMQIAPHFEAYERNFSNLLQVLHIPMDMIAREKEQVIAYFADLISKKYYINMGLDEYYIPDRVSYQKKHHVHVNFIYGVNMEKKVFYLMGFDTFLKFSEIGFEGFFHAIQFKTGPTAKINLYKYSSKRKICVFNTAFAISILEAYINGDNICALSSTKMIINDRKEPLIYGLKIHETILSQEKHLNALKEDIRIAYQLYEHNLIMVKMIEFLSYIGILSSEEFEKDMRLFHDAFVTSTKLRNLVLKGKAKDVDNINSRLILLLKKLKLQEKEAVLELVQYLKTYALV